jgi:hypothetical protein
MTTIAPIITHPPGMAAPFRTCHSMGWPSLADTSGAQLGRTGLGIGTGCGLVPPNGGLPPARQRREEGRRDGVPAGRLDRLALAVLIVVATFAIVDVEHLKSVVARNTRVSPIRWPERPASENLRGLEESAQSQRVQRVRMPRVQNLRSVHEGLGPML